MVARVRLGQFQRAWNGHCRRAECLDWLLIIGRRHLAHVLRIYVQHYKRDRPHRGLALQPPEPAHAKQPLTGDVRRRDRLGGLVHEYYRAAA